MAVPSFAAYNAFPRQPPTKLLQLADPRVLANELVLRLATLYRWFRPRMSIGCRRLTAVDAALTRVSGVEVLN